jgi:pimeloyl-ACP methyl ester carboxylesterase
MSEPSAQRQRRLLSALQQQSLFSAYLKPDLRRDLEDEAADPELHDAARLVRTDMLARIRELLADPERRPDLVSEAPGVSAGTLSLFFSTDLVVVVPGFLGSSLSDVAPNGYGLIWLNPIVAFRDRLGLLRLAAFRKGQEETDFDPHVQIEPTGVLPILYDLLRADLEPRRYSVALFAVDWRKDLEAAALRLRDRLREMLDLARKPIHLIAHSQGAMVARRALQLLRDAVGEKKVLERLKNLVLLGPANEGSFSAAFAVAGNHDLIRKISPYVVPPEGGFQPVLASMSGVYQLLPWNADRLPWLSKPDYAIGKPAFWKQEVDRKRLGAFYGWAEEIDTRFFNGRTAVILGDNYGTPTPAGVGYTSGELRTTHVSGGDGTVPDCCAYLEGVATFRARNTEHMRLPTYARVLRAVRDKLAGRVIQEDADLAAVDRGDALRPGTALDEPRPFAASMPAAVPAAAAPLPAPKEPEHAWSPVRREPPPFRRLRAFALDPSLSRRLETTDINQVTIHVPWEDNLEPGPVGEYLEVVDVDPPAGCFYEPVNLNDPYIVAQDGLAPSEGTPQFHQQMVYAVAMTTIQTFEMALGRRAMWSPRITSKPDGQVTHDYIPRLRIYPHALREENAYYSPAKKALLLGYFRARSTAGGLLPPEGTVFTCLSHDIVAHESTHALLDGLHRYFNESSNPDVLAFHEAFADIIALFQHFSGGAARPDRPHARRSDEAEPARRAGRRVRPGDRKPRGAARCHRLVPGRRLEAVRAEGNRL